MIKAGIRPGAGGVVAFVTFQNSRRVRCRFPGRSIAVVAATAWLRNIRVVETNRVPVSGIVTVVAFAVGGHVTRWHAGSGDAVVTGPAGANNRIVIDLADTGKADGIVAVRALLRALDV